MAADNGLGGGEEMEVRRKGVEEAEWSVDGSSAAERALNRPLGCVPEDRDGATDGEW
jgi:hypothetical protein